MTSSISSVVPRRIQTCLAGGLMFVLGGSVACRDLAGNAELPAGTQGPNTYNTEAGALGAYRGVKANLSVMEDYVVATGALTDELTYRDLGNGPGSIGATGDFTDERVIAEDGGQTDNTYASLQHVRGSASEAIGLLGTYAKGTSPALRGEMYTIAGYAEMLLAELYCSGVPLSTLDYQQDFTYKPSSSTTEVLQHAVALFDSALAISSDSASVTWFASVAKGRALLDLGQYADAGAAVAAVPDTFRYETSVTWPVAQSDALVFTWSVGSGEGGNGLPFAEGGDPRTPVIDAGVNDFGVPQFKPVKYPPNSVTPIVLASGLEARLVEAEVAVRTHQANWLEILNALRTTCTSAVTCPTPAPAGIGGVEGLPPLSDPGSDSARLTLVFDERAYWLFLTGHRQGDLRRLVRNDVRPQEHVYPAGPYFGGLGFYGADVNFPIPSSERINPLYNGCLDRGA